MSRGKAVVVSFILFTLGCSSPPTNRPASTTPVKIWTTQELETKTSALLHAQLQKHDVSDYFFTDEVVITYDTNPRSHPHIAIHTRYHEEPDRLLVLFIHEQLHWYLEANKDAVTKAQEEITKLDPEVPVGIPNGGGFSEQSSYDHIVLCALELQAARRFLGEEKAKQLFETAHIYRWIYEKVLSDEAQLFAILERHRLPIEPAPK